MMRKPGLILFFFAKIIFFDASMGWAENAVYCKTTQVVKIDEHALAKSKNGGESATFFHIKAKKF